MIPVRAEGARQFSDCERPKRGRDGVTSGSQVCRVLQKHDSNINVLRGINERNVVRTFLYNAYIMSFLNHLII